VSYSGKNRRRYESYSLIGEKLEVDFDKDELDIIIEALYRHAADLRDTKARMSAAASTLRKRLIVLEVAHLGEASWAEAQPALPPEST